MGDGESFMILYHHGRHQAEEQVSFLSLWARIGIKVPNNAVLPSSEQEFSKSSAEEKSLVSLSTSAVEAFTQDFKEMVHWCMFSAITVLLDL